MPKKSTKPQKSKPLSRSGQLVNGKLTALPSVAMPPKSSTWPTVIHHDGKTGWGGTRSWTRVDNLLAGAKRPDSKTGHVSLDLKVLVTEVLTGGDRATLKTKMLNPAFTEWLMGFPLGWTDVAWGISDGGRLSRSPSIRRRSQRRARVSTKMQITRYYSAYSARMTYWWNK